MSFRNRVHEVIFEADTPLGKLFDVSLLVIILLSIIGVSLESVESIQAKYGKWLTAMDWIITILFTIEYCLRIYAIKKPWKYIFSFYGLVDLLSILPTYMGLFVSGTKSLQTIRALRLLRIFRVLKLSRYLQESKSLGTALRASRVKITVFLGAVLVIVMIMGSLMYLVEGGRNPAFDSIPRSVYWAIVTVTTVGYGDIAPVSGIGQFFSAILMIVGYGVLAVPTGIVTAEVIRADKDISTNTRACSSCGGEGHDDDADFCKHCGVEL